MKKKNRFDNLNMYKLTYERTKSHQQHTIQRKMQKTQKEKKLKQMNEANNVNFLYHYCAF